MPCSALPTRPETYPEYVPFFVLTTLIACLVMVVPLPRGWKYCPGAVDNVLCHGTRVEVVTSVTMLKKLHPYFPNPGQTRVPRSVTSRWPAFFCCLGVVYDLRFK